jgi:transcriptional regulator with XRE-family HTH domain
MIATPTPTRDPREALIAWRESIPYTQAEVGALFGVSKAAVGWWETGRGRVPRRVRARLRAEGYLTGRWAPWTEDHDAWMRAHVGTYPLPELAARLTAAFGVPRSPLAVYKWLRIHGESAQVVGLLTRTQIAALCGTSPPTVKRWVERGLLQPPPWAQSCGMWAVPPAALHAFIDAHAVQLTVAAMPPSPFRDQAAAIWTRERWLDSRAAIRYAGVSQSTFCLWASSGALPAVRQYREGAGFAYMVRARDLAAFLRRRAA